MAMKSNIKCREVKFRNFNTVSNKDSDNKINISKSPKDNLNIKLETQFTLNRNEARPRPATLLKRDSDTTVSLSEFCKI